MQISIIIRQYKAAVSVICLLLALSACSLQKGGEWEGAELDITSGESVFKSFDAELPAAIKPLISQADTHMMNKQWPKAIAVLERALRINKKQAETWTRMALAYRGKNELEQAIQMARRSNNYTADKVALKIYNWQLISNAYFKLNKLDKAQSAARKSEQLQGSNE